MTRINLVPVESLMDQHLLAEHREIKRVPSVILSGRYSLEGMPSRYTMGKGHVKFFYNKIGFLYERYLKLHKECKMRGFNVDNYGSNFLKVDSSLMGGYNPSQSDIKISQERINEKLSMRPGFYRKTPGLS